MGKGGRSPTHAGSWYENDGETLARQIDQWMAGVAAEPHVHARAIIAPHAGYRYCGHVMAHAYRHIDPSRVSRVFLLGPSHHVYTQKCVLSLADSYNTPLGNITVDRDICQMLRDTGNFEVMDKEIDEAEHSLELHTPYILQTLRNQHFTLVPIMVGVLTADSEEAYGKVLAPYLNDSRNLFVISSDFCHWGTRFRYTLYDARQGPIWKFIELLDHEGIRAIESADPNNFKKYLQETHNTICGRHPIGLFLHMLQQCGIRHKIEFKYYDQSSRCETEADSSVSYAAAVVTAS